MLFGPEKGACTTTQILNKITFLTFQFYKVNFIKSYLQKKPNTFVFGLL